ncbi:HD domain-containing protein [Colwellia ponticola]|uniref:HDIG domain-containing protein n=1 Tax=Colwellia ponticola TaxID=2304625 RepID=A0A8H2PL29_9GAMM|nr:HD domain-containing protein [Colwellia ponticola]TMM47055.1 HDIG domain-containing protein [Colwellia ponticola]
MNNLSVNSVIPMSDQPNLNNFAHLKRFKGCYRLVGLSAKIDRNKQPYWVVQLSDLHHCVAAYLFTVPLNMHDFHHGAMLQCEMTIKLHKHNKYLHLVYIEKASNALCIKKSGLHSLPCALSPDKSLLPLFFSLVESIENNALKEFIAEVLMPSNVCVPFIQAPASLNYHHNYPGGLLAHSIEVAQIVSNIPWQESNSRDLAITAALLHDIGKVKTLTANMRRTPIGHWVDHDALTLEICSKALATLERLDENSATLLRHIWTCASPGARYGYKAATPIASAIQGADRLSADMAKPANALCYQ